MSLNGIGTSVWPSSFGGGTGVAWGELHFGEAGVSGSTLGAIVWLSALLCLGSEGELLTSCLHLLLFKASRWLGEVIGDLLEVVIQLGVQFLRAKCCLVCQVCGLHHWLRLSPDWLSLYWCLGRRVVDSCHFLLRNLSELPLILHNLWLLLWYWLETRGHVTHGLSCSHMLDWWLRFHNWSLILSVRPSRTSCRITRVKITLRSRLECIMLVLSLSPRR